MEISDSDGIETPKRGPGRPPKASVPEGGAKTTATVVYKPLDMGDPHTTRTHGITFHANVPQEIPLDHKIRVEDSKEHIHVLDMLRANPWFSVDGKSARRVKPTAPPVPPPGTEPPPAFALDDSKMVEVD